MKLKLLKLKGNLEKKYRDQHCCFPNFHTPLNPNAHPKVSIVHMIWILTKRKKRKEKREMENFGSISACAVQ